VINPNPGDAAVEMEIKQIQKVGGPARLDIETWVFSRLVSEVPLKGLEQRPAGLGFLNDMKPFLPE
jgi:hypothetical protein